MTADAQPILPLPDGFGAEPPRRRRRALPWIIAVVVIAILAVAAAFIAEMVTRDILSRTVREQVITQLALPADQQVDVGVNEPVLPQVIAGRLDRLNISSVDVPLGDVVADISVRATGVPIRGDGDIDSADATVVLGEDQLRTLLTQAADIPDAQLELTPPTVQVSFDLPIFALTVPLGIELTPGARDGDILLTPTSVTVAGNQLTADGLRDRFGSGADAVLQGYAICIKDRLPAGLSVREVVVEPGELVAQVDIDGAIIHDTALQENGTCA